MLLSSNYLTKILQQFYCYNKVLPYLQKPNLILIVYHNKLIGTLDLIYSEFCLQKVLQPNLRIRFSLLVISTFHQMDLRLTKFMQFRAIEVFNFYSLTYLIHKSSTRDIFFVKCLLTFALSERQQHQQVHCRVFVEQQFSRDPHMKMDLQIPYSLVAGQYFKVLQSPHRLNSQYKQHEFHLSYLPLLLLSSLLDFNLLLSILCLILQNQLQETLIFQSHIFLGKN